MMFNQDYLTDHKDRIFDNLTIKFKQSEHLVDSVVDCRPSQLGSPFFLVNMHCQCCQGKTYWISQKEICQNGCTQLEKLCEQVQDFKMNGMDFCNEQTCNFEGDDDIEFRGSIGQDEGIDEVIGNADEHEYQNHSDSRVDFDFSSDDENETLAVTRHQSTSAQHHPLKERQTHNQLLTPDSTSALTQRLKTLSTNFQHFSSIKQGNLMKKRKINEISGNEDEGHSFNQTYKNGNPMVRSQTLGAISTQQNTAKRFRFNQQGTFDQNGINHQQQQMHNFNSDQSNTNSHLKPIQPYKFYPVNSQSQLFNNVFQKEQISNYH